jgi:hypothetical protein
VRILVPLVCLAAAAFGISPALSAYSWDDPEGWLPDLVVGLTFIACAVLGWVRGRARGATALFGATGVTWFLGNFSADLLYLHRGPLIHLVLAYPGWRARSRLDLAAIAVGYAAAILASVWQSDVATIVLVSGLVAVAVRGYAAASGAVRRERLSALQAATALGAVLIVGAITRLVVPSGGADQRALLAYEVVLVAVAVGLYRRLRGPVAAVVTDLVVELAEARSGTLRDRLARALGDPTLELGYWSSDAVAYVDAAGKPLVLPDPESGTFQVLNDQRERELANLAEHNRHVRLAPSGREGRRSATPVEHEGLPSAVLVHDAAVLQDPALLEAVLSATRLSASHFALQAEVVVQAAELIASRRRLLLAADLERQQLEARLREGPERRLVDVAETLSRVSPDANGPSIESLDRAKSQLSHALVELDELGRGLHPRDLVEAGLQGALASLAERTPIPVDLEVSVMRLPDEFEAAVYFVSAEALANVVKYASASRATLTVAATDHRLSVVVADDGIGDADPSHGTGLQGLVDRIEALGGTLQVDSPPGGGTRLTIKIPLDGAVR